jgi:CBS domain containing-hemolysin-like protein
LTESGRSAGILLEKFKLNMEQPITAILIVNTVANTAGAAIAGAQARDVFDGKMSVFAFSAVFTLMVLFLSEIMPKVAGVAYNRSIAPAVSTPLNRVISCLRPIVWVTQRLSSLLGQGKPQLFAPEEEVQQMAALSAEEGSILAVEARLIKHALGLDDIKVKDILTPRTVVLSAAGDTTVEDFLAKAPGKLFSRIPIHAPDDPENWIGIVRSQDILAHVAQDDFETELQDLSHKLRFVPEAMRGHTLLGEFLKHRAHMVGVVDEYGSVVGIVTLEDVMESLIGKEIMDETDTVTDLQVVAREKGQQRLGASSGGKDDRKNK